MPGMTTDQLPLLMMIAGIGILGWLIIRRRMLRVARQRGGPQAGVPAAAPKLKYNSQAHIRPSTYTGVGSMGAPADALQWQLDLHDLGRELKAELDNKLVAVRSVTQAYDRSSRRLLALIRVAERSISAETGILGRLRTLSEQGFTVEQIAIETGLSETDVIELTDICGLAFRSESNRCRQTPESLGAASCRH
jgi:hypothetical protein